ncbi:DUF4145 domain-containing protein [Glaciihabitans sp. INWT7]|uniref:DUF4145 domain-containing protein n=1 Tax=Glaciihabitans sp. INWT7 TaxID=2596912 RepID=UPI00162A20F7|nr:DUF4145 domain-containing protein [Glaciihabitans sp. INWT7]
MPDQARELYEEARQVAGVSRRAGAALARATLERFLRDFDTAAPAGATLADRIDRVVPQVSAGLGELLTLIRHVGNKSLHVEDAPDEAVVLVLDEENTEMIDALFVAINDLVEELITKPARTSRLAALIPQSVRDAAARRAKPGANRD